MQPLVDDSYTYGFHKPEDYVYKSEKGLNESVVRTISGFKQEPKWMEELRLKSYLMFLRKALPQWGGDLSTINFDDIYYYIKPTKGKVGKWADLPDDIRDTYDKIGIPEAEKKFLAGVSAQYESEVVYKSIQSMLTKKGVIFLDMDSGLREYPDLVKQYFGTIIPPGDNKFAALNSAVWSGGSFVYVPKGVKVELPLQAYFRINAANMGQFERTLIIAEEGSFVHYVEGCLPVGEQVSLGDRWVNIESVKPRDLVIGDDGKEHKVKAVMTRNYSGDLVGIRPVSPYNTFAVTPEHPVLAVKRDRVGGRKRFGWLSEVSSKLLLNLKPSYCPAGELKRGDFIVFPKVQTDRSYDMTRDELKLLGYFLAEGSTYIHKTLKQPVVCFSCSEFEQDFYSDIVVLIKKITGKRAMIIHDKKKHGIEVRVYSEKLRQLCLAHCGKGASTKVLSNEIMSLPAQSIRLFIDAYWRGDGNVLQRRGSTLMRASTASEMLARQLQELCTRIGIYLSIQIRTGGTDLIAGRIIQRKTQYIMVYTPNKKWTKVRENASYFLVPIENVSRTPYHGPVFNLDVAEVNSYLVRGFAVHNCTAPIYTTDSLHSAVVEIIVKKGARVRYTTIQNWSTNVYNLVTKRARVEEEGIMEWVDGNLGCLAEGSMVTTPKGIKSIETVKLGDRLLSWDELNECFCFRSVLSKRFSGNQPIHTVSVGERKLRVTANHPFYSYKYDSNIPKKLGRYQLGYVRADILKQAIIPCVSIAYGVPFNLITPTLTTTFSSMNQYAPKLQMTRKRTSKMHQIQQSTEELMWLFGYWVGDGDSEVVQGKTKGVIRYAKLGFSTPVNDRARKQLIKTMTALVDNFPTQRADGHHLTWNSKELVELFRINGFIGNAQTKRVPRWVWSVPESQRLAFVAGYLDADGTTSRGWFSLKSVQRPLLEDTASLLVTLGITSRLHTEFDQPKRVKIMKNECTAHGSYRLVFNGDERLYPWISSSLMEKTKAGASHVLDMHRNVGRSSIQLNKKLEIVPIRYSKAIEQDVPTWDIEVEGTGNFVSQGFIVHNSKLTMKYPSVYLVGRKSHGEVLSIASAGRGQHQDAGGKAVHIAPETTSRIISKSISRKGGRTSYRGLVQVYPGAFKAKSKVVCDALLLDDASRSDTYPTMKIDEKDVTIEHEATVSKIGDEQLFYLESRGITKTQAESMIVNGFIEPIVKELPLEYAVELNRLIQLQMEGSVG